MIKEHDVFTASVPKEMFQIPGFPKYYINKEGCIWSQWHSGKYLKPCIRDDGYIVHTLCTEDRQQKTIILGITLLTTFVRPKKPGELCRHLNDIKLDDRLENLAWGTKRDNIMDAIRNGKHYSFPAFQKGEMNGHSKLFPLDVINIHHLYQTGKYTYAAIGRLYNISPEHISLIIRGRNWKKIFAFLEKQKND